MFRLGYNRYLVALQGQGTAGLIPRKSQAFEQNYPLTPFLFIYLKREFEGKQYSPQAVDICFEKKDHFYFRCLKLQEPRSYSTLVIPWELLASWLCIIITQTYHKGLVFCGFFMKFYCQTKCLVNLLHFYLNYYFEDCF